MPEVELPVLDELVLTVEWSSGYAGWAWLWVVHSIRWSSIAGLGIDEAIEPIDGLYEWRSSR